MFYDEEAVKEVAVDFKVSTEWVKKCLSVAECYEKSKKRHRSLREQARKEAARLKQLDDDMAAHPDDCFCEEQGLEVTHDPDKDEVIGSYKTYGYGDWGQQYPYDAPIYKCSRCGKGWIVRVAWA